MRSKLKRLDVIEDDSSRSNLVGGGRPVSFCIGRRVLNLFCASGWQLYSTEVELFVLIESSNGVDFALQFGKAWNRSLVGRDFL